MAKQGSSSRSPRFPRVRRGLAHPLGKAVVGFVAFVVVFGLAAFLYFYIHYANLIEEKLSRGPYPNTSMLFAAPQVVNLGDDVTEDDLIDHLHRAGYSESRSNRMGWYRRSGDGLEVYPGPDSYFQQEAHVVRLERGRVAQIISLRDNTDRTQFWLEPQLITNLFDRNREKRRFVPLRDIPPVVRDALLAAEDKRFFQHAGFDPVRIIKSAYVDLKEGRNKQGASTLSMQLARSLWLTTERSWRRKLPEVLITLHLERKLTKEEIFEHYVNQIYVGRVGSFNIHGLGEGAQAYFGKDLRKLTLPEAALLVGLIQGPSLYNPFRNPDRARQRRNVILQLMRANDAITQRQYEEAATAPLGVVQSANESADAPYFVDLVNDQLLNKFQDLDFQTQSHRVYTTLDPNLQRAAAEAMREGLKEVDAIMERRKRTPARGWPQVQAALVAVEPSTGEIKAFIGGRDYGQSQLNRAVARRQPGSAFKPFVYAAALETGLEGGPQAITPASVVDDEPSTFWFDNKAYEPNNFKGEYHGPVTLRQALAKSLNIPTVKFAEEVGYDRVAALARKVGLSVQATPAIALGAYEVRPLDIAAAYTVFANGGVFVSPSWIKLIRDQTGATVYTATTERREVLDPRIAYMMVNLMEEVIRSGTAAGVRARGFTLPAAGKTGTSHDGWFAGFTTSLICVVWVGYDDNRELELEGSKSALPIWTEFMKRAHRFRPYRRATAFSAPEGVVTVNVDVRTGKLAAAGGCGGPARTEVFLLGTQPLEYCGGGATQVAGWDSSPPAEVEAAPEGERPRRVASRRVESGAPREQPAPSPSAQAQEKKGILSRFLGLFKR